MWQMLCVMNCFIALAGTVVMKGDEVNVMCDELRYCISWHGSDEG